MPGVNPGVVTALDCPAAFLRAEQEMEFVEKNRLSCLTLKDEAYPSRLRECEDAPIVLFFKGNTDFNRLHVIDMVGTRRATDYGKQFCADFLRDLAVLCPDVLVVSGLAYGIDIHAHRAALANHLPTVAVLAHGLDRIYPYVHRKTAIDMLAQGGLLTEFLTGTNPDKHNFVSRNRIVAGMSDATIVVESAAKGGSLITAELAEGYHRDCFAVPGRVTDESSIGCNRLIRDNKAALIQSAEEFVQIMGWAVAEQPARTEGIQRNLFPELTEDRRKELAKDIKKKGEGAKVAVRNIRRDAMDHFKKVGKAEDISEDEIKDLEDKIQKLTDSYVAKIDKAVEAKSQEILTV